MGLGWTEVIIVVAIFVLLFGASKIPELARGVGEGISEFKKATNQELEENNDNNKTETSSGSGEEKVKSS